MSEDIRELQQQVDALEKTLGTLITWMVRELGSTNAKTLLNMMQERNK